MLTALQLALVQFRNAKACRAIDSKRAGLAPEVRPVSITANQRSLMPVVPRKPPAKQSFGESYVNMVRLGMSGHKLHCALELSHPAFEVQLNVIDRLKVSSVRIPASECSPSASSLVPEKGWEPEDCLALAPYRLDADGRKVWLP